MDISNLIDTQVCKWCDNLLNDKTLGDVKSRRYPDTEEICYNCYLLNECNMARNKFWDIIRETVALIDNYHMKNWDNADIALIRLIEDLETDLGTFHTIFNEDLLAGDDKYAKKMRAFLEHLNPK